LGFGPVRRRGVAAVVLLAAFVVWELCVPIRCPFGIFRLRTLRAANVVTLLFGAWNGARVLILALYLQRVLGYSPLEAGLASVPQGLAGLTAGLVGRVSPDRFGIKGLLLAPPRLPWPGTCSVSGHCTRRLRARRPRPLFAVGLGNGGTAFAATVAARRRSPTWSKESRW